MNWAISSSLELANPSFFTLYAKLLGKQVCASKAMFAMHAANSKKILFFIWFIYLIIIVCYWMYYKAAKLVFFVISCMFFLENVKKCQSSAIGLPLFYLWYATAKWKYAVAYKKNVSAFILLIEVFVLLSFCYIFSLIDFWI